MTMRWRMLVNITLGFLLADWLWRTCWRLAELYGPQ